MALEQMLLGAGILWLKRNPSMCPQRLFFLAGEPVHPFWRHWCMLLSFAPFAQPQDVLWRCRHLAQRADLGVLRITIMEGCLVLLLLFELLPDLPVCVPVQARQQVLIVEVAGHP